MRAVLLWLFMLALPLQGVAAVAMSYCALPAASGAGAVHAMGHADSHEHAAHDHDMPSQVHASHAGDIRFDLHGDAQGNSQGLGHATHHAASADTGDFHKCGACASCHANAMVGTLPFQPLATLPQADLAETFAAPASPPLRVLDKPPRA
ncbi:hypothetical protein [Variovorax sp. KK3]|uniref:hypothetical protein n=1 Tax=Variovorax sp. KK3 TaxID=1855728 RepID=UPI00117EF6E7